ncbi:MULTISPECIES: hypothetical protein [Burkholderia]|uniref:hypothetical protein n=1 Tax=Burkholderia TaxID=32008 RepID=UPI000758FBD1|nr:MULTISPECIES: hypothetical protein [Burkholderia]KVU60471.1 hypothetical protein WK70_08805 [Burkholderia cepacia]MCA8218958.1 hypothetical protein [Burkholderia cepacia]MDC6104090.1 hypothetical protein [Burkholderia cepacia]
MFAARAASSAPVPSRPADRNAIIRDIFADGASLPDLTSHHVALMKKLRVMWVPVESGAPDIDPLHPRIGEGPTIALARSALKTDDDALAIRTLAELGHLVPVFVTSAGTLAPGRYTIPPALHKLFAFKESGVDASGRFEFRAAYLAVLRGASWRTVDVTSIDDVLGERDFWPMPYIDGKRPYGDCMYYQFYMAELLGEPYKRDAGGNLVKDGKKDARLEWLHCETLAALQVFLMHADLTKPV